MASVEPLVERHIKVLSDKSGLGVGCKDPKSVRVTCQFAQVGSVSKVFHVGLPVGAQVKLLRQRLKPHLAAGAAVLGDSPVYAGLQVWLDDSDFVPETVVLPRFDGKVVSEMVLTKNQCRKVQQLLQLIFETPEVQQRLNDFEEHSEGVEHKYLWRLGAMLQCEIYPSIARYFGLDEKAGAVLPVAAIGSHSQYDLRMTEAWLNLEILMRNKERAAQAYMQLAHLQAPDSGPQLAPGSPGAQAECPSWLPSEPVNPLWPLADRGADGARQGRCAWPGDGLLQSALQDGEDLLAAEFRLSDLLERPDEGRERRCEWHVRRAAVRLGLGLYDAALADAVAAEGAAGAAAAYVAANAGLQRYDEALHFDGKHGLREGDALNEGVRSHIELLTRQSQGNMDWERMYWGARAPALLPQTAEYLGPVKLGLLGYSSSRRRCLFAARAVEAGELLMSSCALVNMRAAGGKRVAGQISGMPYLRETVTVALAVYRRAAQISAHAANVLGTALSDGCFRAVLPMRELFWHGAPAHGLSVEDAVVSGVICTNAFKDLDHSIFPAASMANHSCLPNAVVVKLGDTFLLRARKSIDSGQEITISYYDTMVPLSERAERCKGWKFTCVCPRCEAERRIPRAPLVVPLAMLKQLNGMRAAVMGNGNVSEVIEELEAAVGGCFSGKTDEALWVCSGFVGLYMSLAEASESSDAWDKLLRLFEVAHPGSFLHCKLTLNRWRVARTEGAGQAQAPAAWRQCVEAHRLRYGEMSRDTFTRLLEETRQSVDQSREEFCMD